MSRLTTWSRFLCFSWSRFRCLGVLGPYEANRSTFIRQAIVSCGLALIFLGGLVPELSSRFGFYDLVFVGFCISVAGIRIFIYGRRLQLGHDQ